MMRSSMASAAVVLVSNVSYQLETGTWLAKIVAFLACLSSNDFHEVKDLVSVS